MNGTLRPFSTDNIGRNTSPLSKRPREDAGGLSREYVLRIPSVS